jgi:hypothetical protein
MAAMTPAELQAEIATALRRAETYQLRHKPTPAPKAAQCGVCEASLHGVPVFGCSLRRHVFCGSCVERLGGRHRCTVCCPGGSVAYTTTQTEADRRDAASFVAGAKALSHVRVLPSTTSRPDGAPVPACEAPLPGQRTGAVATIESWVDPTRRDLPLELA